MKFLEKDLEDIICEGFINHTAKNQLLNRGLTLFDRHLFYKRQLRIDGVGIADLVIYHRNPYYQDHIHVCVIELKRGTISNQTIYQCNRYIHGITRYLDSRNINHTINGCVIGNKSIIDMREIEREELHMINSYTYDYKVDGISFIYKELFNV